MEFLPWKTVDLDGAFRVTAPESTSEDIIQEVSNGISFRFNNDLKAVKLEILLTAPWGWEDCFPMEERESPPAQFICRLISRSTGRRLTVVLKQGDFGTWFSEISFKSLREGEELRAEALLIRNKISSQNKEGYAKKKGQIIGRSKIHTVRFTGKKASNEVLFNLKWEKFPSGSSQQLWRLQPGEPPTVELNSSVEAPLKKLLMSRSKRRQGGSLQRDVLFVGICSAVWPILVSDVLLQIQRIVDENPSIGGVEAIDSLSIWQIKLLSLFAPGLLSIAVPEHEALPCIPLELKSPGGFTRFMMKMPELIQEETKLVQLAETMAKSINVDEEKQNVELEASEVRVA